MGDTAADFLETAYYGCSFFLGRSCWHVVGHLNGDALRSVLLCGGRPSEYGIGGRTADVLASDMPVCKVCDRVTGGGAQGDVDRLRIDLCGRCDPNGLVWDPTVDGNVIGCDHELNRLKECTHG